MTTTDLRLVPASAAAWLACALAVGAPVPVAAAASAALAATALVCVALRVPPTAWLALAVAALACASCAAQLHQRASGELVGLAAQGAAVAVEGVVRGEPGCAGEGCRPVVVVAADVVTGRGRTGPAAARVLAVGPVGDVPYGARVRLRGALAPAAPGDDVVAVLRVVVAPEVLAPPGAVHTAVGAARRALADRAAGLPPDLRGLVPGLAVGDTSRLPPDLDRAMRDVGLTHVTAVSGAHFSVLTVAVLGAASVLRLPRAARAAVSAAAMGAFVLLVHPEPSVVRAAVMGGVGVLGILARRPSRAVPALGVAVSGLLVLDPWLARSYGFVLSVVATAAISLLAPAVVARLRERLPRWLAVAVAVPLAAQAACGPVLVLLDPAVSTVAVPANLLAAPALVPGTVLGVGAAATAAWCPPLADVLIAGSAAGAWWITAVARAAAALPAARVPWPSGAGGALLLAVVTAAGFTLVLHPGPGRALRRLVRGPARGERAPDPDAAAATRVGAGVGRLAAWALVVVVAVGAVRWSGARAWAPEDWRVVQCDVGQGDALVVRSGERSAVVVDVGPPGPAADACLRDLGVTRVDLLVLSHFHADHVGGLPAVLRGRDVAAALVSPLAEPAAQAASALAALRDAGVPVSAAGQDGPRSGRAGAVTWRVLGPSGPAVEPNDASVVLLLEVDGLGVLALGDAETAAQEALAERIVADRAARGAVVVKVAHHGSAVQSARLAGLLAPAVALVGVGADNEYGHPAPSTVDLYRDRGALVLATHVCGPIALAPRDGELAVHARCLGR